MRSRPWLNLYRSPERVNRLSVRPYTVARRSYLAIVAGGFLAGSIWCGLDYMRRFSKGFVLLGLLAGCMNICAEEGKWTPQQVLQLDQGWLKKQGLQLPISKLW